MLGFKEMLARMPILRIIAATHVSASPAQAKMHPSVAHGEAFLTTVAARDHGPYGIEVSALQPSFSHGRTSVGMRFAPCAAARRGQPARSLAACSWTVLIASGMVSSRASGMGWPLTSENP